jgi:hypothetical protein
MFQKCTRMIRDWANRRSIWEDPDQKYEIAHIIAVVDVELEGLENDFIRKESDEGNLAFREIADEKTNQKRKLKRPTKTTVPAYSDHPFENRCQSLDKRGKAYPISHTHLPFKSSQ